MAKANIKIASDSITVKKNLSFTQNQKLKYTIHLGVSTNKRDPKEYGWKSKNEDIINSFFEKRKDFATVFRTYVKDFLNGKHLRIKTVSGQTIKFKPDEIKFNSWNDVKKFDWDAVMRGAYASASKAAFKLTPHTVYFKDKKGRSKDDDRSPGNVSGQLDKALTGTAKKG